MSEVQVNPSLLSKRDREIFVRLRRNKNERAATVCGKLFVDRLRAGVARAVGSLVLGSRSLSVAGNAQGLVHGTRNQLAKM